jgi:lysyl-tRNA synthetase, class II
VRTAGSKLVFMDIGDGTGEIQVVCQFSQLPDSAEDFDAFKSFAKTARRGDWFTIVGWPHKTARGEVSILATELPRLVSPSLHQIPDTLDDAETRTRHRHVDMLVHPETIHPLIVRSLIENELNDFFQSQSFIKVNTPLLTAGAGGAVARPFETEATELQGQKLNLRIAPELWLKRLIVGGMRRVYEIGPAFRNEGVDATHNPEFSTCEFYEAFATLDRLMEKTEALLNQIATTIGQRRQAGQVLEGLTGPVINFERTFQRLEFIPTLEREMGITLPNLSANDAAHSLLTIFASQEIPVPTSPNLPRLLDALASHYIEPLCHTPTFITHHPTSLSPLAKHYTCPTTRQVISARAEFFIGGREYANMYEEENSPFAQRAKFEDQLRFREVDGEGDGRGEVDESYLEALEWGLPPTGGWGCGIDRLVMLFSGRERIGEVLTFGTLRNVVGVGRRGK